MGPQIETERTLLRLPEIHDAPALTRYLGDYEVAKNTARVPHPYPGLGAEMWVLVTRASWRPEGNQSLIVVHEGEVIGGGGVFRRSAGADWEIGYWIAPPAWGRGFATEVGRALIALGRDRLGATRLIAGHYHDNPASGRVLEKLGFAYTGKEEPLFAMARMEKTVSRDMVLELG